MVIRFLTRKIDKQVFAIKQKGNVRSQTMPRITRQRPRLSKPKRDFIARQIRKEIRSGRGQQQSVAIAFSKARKKFGNSGLELTKTVKNSPQGKLNERTRRLIFLLLGTALALSVLRQITRR